MFMGSRFSYINLRRLPKNMGFWVVVFGWIRDNISPFIGSQSYTWALS